jgi:hypothetical protein
MAITRYHHKKFSEIGGYLAHKYASSSHQWNASKTVGLSLMNIKRHATLGLFLIVISFLPWIAVLIVPLLPLSVTQKALMVPVLAVVAELLFWLGLLILGKEAAQRYRHYLSHRYISNLLGKIWNWLRKFMR